MASESSPADPSKARARLAWRNLLMMVVYVAAGRLSLLLKHPLGDISPLWLPSGVGLVGLMCFGRGVLPGIVLGHIAGSMLSGLGPAPSIAAATAGACEITLADALMRRWGVRSAQLLVGVRPMLRFIAWSAFPAALVGAVLGVGGLVLAGTIPVDAPLARGVAMWLAGDFAGMLIVVPLLVAWRERPGLDLRSRTLLPMALALSATLAIFVLTDVTREGHQVYGFLIFPIVVWCAIMNHTTTSITLHALVAAIAVVATAMGLGPYAVTASITDVWLLQAFVTTLVGMSLMLGAAMKERSRTLERVRHMAMHDALTALPNRHAMEVALDAALVHAREHGGQAGVLFVDVDEFKAVNDSVGHEGGDEVLVQVADRLRGLAREGETFTRPGGDEFVVVARKDSEEAFVDLAQRVIGAMHDPVRVGLREFRLTCSVGIARYPDDAADAATLMRYADISMFQAKASGKNTYEMFSAQAESRRMARIEIEQGLRGALERGEFSLVYQPQVDLATREVIGAEALLRWHSPTLGNVPPSVFIPVAEDLGLVGSIGQWVLGNACAQLRRWVDGGHHALRLAINLSPLQLGPLLADQWRQALAATGVSPELLEAELTESCVMHDTEGNLRVLNELRAMGVRVSLDDFGTGHSSLSLLTRLPLSAVKIDRSFVREVGQPQGAQVVGAVVSLAHRLGLRCTAEGVETQAQADFLRGIGCDAYQGYLLAKPSSAEAFARTFLSPLSPLAPVATVPLH